jgi:hypothetical protein
MAIIEFGTEEMDVALDDGDAVVAADVVIAPSLTPPAASPATRTAAMDERRAPAGRSGRLSGSWAAGLAIAWIAIFTIGVAFEPAPADPNAPLPLIATLLALGLVIGWIVMAVGLAKRSRFGAAASLVAAVCLLGLTIGCPVSGHHSGLGAWWLFEMVGSTTLVALSGRALRSV